MHKYIPILLLIFSFFTSELIAQNLNLKITGETDEETNIINSFNYKKRHENYNSIFNEVDSIQQILTSNGYIENKKINSKKVNDSSFQIQIQLNNKYKKIEISYDSSKIDDELIKTMAGEKFENYFSIPLNKVEHALSYLNLQLSKRGYPFVKINLSKIQIKDKKTLMANLIISEKEKKRSLDKIVVKGYNKFSKSYLKWFLKIKPQKTFNIESIKSKMKTLSNLRFAEQTKEPEVLFTKDSTNLYIYLEKSLSNSFDGFLGFSTNEENNKIDINGYLNLKLNNSLNFGETFNVIYKSDESVQKNFEANIKLPYLFSTPIGAEISLNIFKSDSTFSTVNQKANAFYQINSKNIFFSGIEYVKSNNLLGEESHETILDYERSLFNFKYTYEDKNIINPLFVLKSNINLEFGIGRRKTQNDNESQEKISLDAFNIFNLNRKNSFYTRFTGALLRSNTYLENELFRFGGINSIRGFEENSIIANYFVLINTEYRYQLSKGIYTHTIIDFSNFENKISKTKENLYGFGLGFGISTKAGLLKFNFANGKREAQKFKFSNSKIHISLVSKF